MLTLRLTSPYMTGGVIPNVQEKLRLNADGIYGPQTAGAVKTWKYRYGFPAAYINNTLTASDYAYLTGRYAQTAMMKLRAKSRAATVDSAQEKRTKALSIMRGWAADHLVEQPANSNVVPRLVALGKESGCSAGTYRMGWPWCAYGVMLAALRAGSQTAKDGLISWKFNPLYVPEIEQLARSGRFGMRVVSWADAKPGDFVTFNWDGGVPDHIGMLLSRVSTVATCVEGNTSPSSAGSQSNGGGVYVRDRNRSLIQAVIRWS